MKTWGKALQQANSSNTERYFLGKFDVTCINVQKNPEFFSVNFKYTETVVPKLPHITNSSILLFVFQKRIEAILSQPLWQGREGKPPLLWCILCRHCVVCLLCYHPYRHHVRHGLGALGKLLEEQVLITCKCLSPVCLLYIT